MSGAAAALPRLLARALALVWASGRASCLRLGALTVVQALATVVQLALAGRLVGQVQAIAEGSAELSDALVVVAAFGVAFAVQGAASVWLNEVRVVLGELTTRHALAQISGVATRAPLIEFDRPSFHDLLTRALRSGTSRPMQVTSALTTIASALVLCVALVVTLALIQPLVLLVLLAGGVPAWLLTRQATRLGYRFQVDETEPDRRRSYLLYLLTSRAAAAELRAYQLADEVDRRHDASWGGRIERITRVARRRAVLGSAGRSVNALAIAIIIGVLVWTVSSGRADLTAAATAAGAVALLGQRLTGLLAGVGVLYECALFLSDVDEFSSMFPERSHPPAVDVQRGGDGADDGVLRASDVSFTYPTGNRPAVDAVSVEVRTGEVIALVGANGSGKTTLSKVLAGLLTPDGGTLTWNDRGVDADDVSWHDRVAVVFQDFSQYMLPLRENIRFGRVARDASDDEVRSSLGLVGLDDLPDSLDDGLSTGLGPEYQGATDLSGGQWQRLAIARAFFRDAPIVILDEPSAALDPDAEAQLLDGIEQLTVGRATIIVSHRLSTVTRSDRIYVMSHGRVIEAGPHRELMSRGGEYARMFRLQADRFAGTDDDRPSTHAAEGARGDLPAPLVPTPGSDPRVATPDPRPDPSGWGAPDGVSRAAQSGPTARSSSAAEWTPNRRNSR